MYRTFKISIQTHMISNVLRKTIEPPKKVETICRHLHKNKELQINYQLMIHIW